MMTSKHYRQVEDILTDSSATYSTSDYRVEIKIGSTTFIFKWLGLYDDAGWYYTSRTTYGNFSHVTGDDVTASGYRLNNEQSAAIQTIYAG
tara:strand:- start:1125 stop:1397 length:273 start_codon:yes stop_codon:yes gene_type:complete